MSGFYTKTDENGEPRYYIDGGEVSPYVFGYKMVEESHENANYCQNRTDDTYEYIYTPPREASDGSGKGGIILVLVLLGAFCAFCMYANNYVNDMHHGANFERVKKELYPNGVPQFDYNKYKKEHQKEKK